MGPCKVYSWVPLQICISGFTKDRKVHEATSASQWHDITINIGEDGEEHYDVIDMQIEAQRAVRRITDHQEIVK